MVGTLVGLHLVFAIGEQWFAGLQLAGAEGLMQGTPSELGLGDGPHVMVG
jgi:hypothetical protein